MRSAGQRFDDNILCLQKSSPVGERLASIAKKQNILLMVCDQCAVRRELAEGTFEQCGSGEVKAKGLKTIKKENINKEAGSILQPTDWMVIRATEGGTAVPSSITTQRAAVRTKANEMCTAIDNAADMDALVTLYTYTNTGTEEEPLYTRPLGELPQVG